MLDMFAQAAEGQVLPTSISSSSKVRRARTPQPSNENGSDSDGGVGSLLKRYTSLHEDVKELREHLLSMEAMVAENAKFVRSAITSMGDGTFRSSMASPLTSRSSVSESTPTRSRRLGNSEQGSPALLMPMNPTLIRLVRDLAVNKGSAIRVHNWLKSVFLVHWHMTE